MRKLIMYPKFEVTDYKNGLGYIHLSSNSILCSVEVPALRCVLDFGDKNEVVGIEVLSIPDFKESLESILDLIETHFIERR